MAKLFVPVGASASEYNAPNSLEDIPAGWPRAVIGAARTVAGERASTAVYEPRLSASATELARVACRDRGLDHEVIDFVLRRNGIIEPTPYTLAEEVDKRGWDSYETHLTGRLRTIIEPDGSFRVGVGTARTHGDLECVVVLLQASYVSTKPIPRSLSIGGTVIIDGEIASAFKDPQVFVTGRDGAVLEIPTATSGTVFRARIACAGKPGRRQVEIAGKGVHGPKVLANFPVWCGAKPPDQIELVATGETPVGSAIEAEEELVELVNTARTEHGLPPLAAHSRLTLVARLYSMEMASTGRVAHLSAVSGSADDRVRRSNIHVSVILENVARAYGVRGAHKGLMNSPGHRANILSREATHVGLGVAFGRSPSGAREFYVTQVFAKIPRKLGVLDARALVFRKARAHKSLTEDSKLSSYAQAMARGLSAGMTAGRAEELVPNLSRYVQRRYRSVARVITTTADIDQFEPSKHVLGAGVTHLGVGVAVGPHPTAGPEANFVVIFAASL